MVLNGHWNLYWKVTFRTWMKLDFDGLLENQIYYKWMVLGFIDLDSYQISSHILIIVSRRTLQIKIHIWVDKFFTISKSFSYFVFRFLDRLFLLFRCTWWIRTMIIQRVLPLLLSLLAGGLFLLLCFLQRLLSWFHASLRKRAVICLSSRGHYWTLLCFTTPGKKASFRDTFLQKEVILTSLIFLLNPIRSCMSHLLIIIINSIVSRTSSLGSSIWTNLFRSSNLLGFGNLLESLLLWICGHWKCRLTTISRSNILLRHLWRFLIILVLWSHRNLRCRSTWCQIWRWLKGSGWLSSFSYHILSLFLNEFSLQFQFLEPDLNESINSFLVSLAQLQ